MERKTKIEIILAVLVILVFIGLVVWWKWPVTQQGQVVSTSTASNITTSTNRATSTESTTVDPTNVPVVKETSPSTVARTFVERLGSYSTEADAENIEDILPMATASFQNELRALVREARETTDGVYYGVSTIVITSPKTVSASATQTVLSMTTQREETMDTPENTVVSYQAITITLVKSGTTWLVDDYSWSEKM